MSNNIQFVPPGALKPYARNARTHSKQQIRQLADSIRRFGFSSPVLVDVENQIIADHGRVAAAIQIGIDTVPLIRISHLSPDEIRALRLADNKIVAAAGWDEERLTIELRELELTLGEDITMTGFSTAEIDIALRNTEADDFLETFSEVEAKRPQAGSTRSSQCFARREAPRSSR